MKRLIQLLAKMYPRWWRERYGVEFRALLEDDSPRFTSACNVLGSALFMQLRTLVEGSPGALDLEPLMRNRWLLACSGIAQAGISAIYFLMQNSYAPLSFHAWNRAIALLGYFEFAAGIFGIAAGLIATRSHKSWLLVLNGVAFASLGVIHCTLIRFPIRFTTIAAIVGVMAVSVAMLALRIARTLKARDLATRGRVTSLAALGSAVFIMGLSALSLRWIPIQPGSHTDLVWMGAYFAFSAVFMLSFGFQFRRPAV